MPSDHSMTPRAWLAKTIGLTILLVVAVAATDAAIDIYGIFRNPKGRHLAGYGDDRVAKYLLSERYVPANFNALVIGSSISANWDTSHIDAFKMYNESLDGGNIVEEKTISDRALASSRIKLAIVVIQPFLTSSHEFETVHVTPRENLEALGSQNLLDAYKDELRAHFHKDAQIFDDTGVMVLPEVPRELNPIAAKVMDPVTGFKVDPVALQAHQDLVAELHAAKIPIVFIVSAISRPLLSSRATRLAAYSRLLLRDKSDSDKVIDFTSPDFEAFREVGTNFSDGIHLTNVGSREIVVEINQRLNDWVRTGQLHADIDKAEEIAPTYSILRREPTSPAIPDPAEPVR